MTDLSARNSLLARRRAAEARFRRYGAAALALTTLFLAFLLWDVAAKGWPAFLEHRVALPVAIDPARAAAGDFDGLVKDAILAQFPEAQSRSQRKAVLALFSRDGETQVARQLAADPGLSGKTITADLLLSDTADLHLKGIAPLADATAITALTEKLPVTRAFAWRFFSNGDSREAEQAGLRGALIGSLLTVAVALGLGLVFGVAAAVYLEEFAPKNRFTDFIEVNINNLAAVPSIIFGLLGLAMFLNVFGLPRSSPLVGGLVLSLLVLPTIIIAARAALKAVPPSIKEAALGVGASEQQAVFHHVLPLALPGILTGAILGMARAFGETAPLLMIGMGAVSADVPRGITEAATVLPVQIYLWSDLPELAFRSKTAAAILVLIAVLFAANALAIYLRNRFERRW